MGHPAWPVPAAMPQTGLVTLTRAGEIGPAPYPAPGAGLPQAGPVEVLGLLVRRA